VSPHAWHDLLHNVAALVLTLGGAVLLVRAWRARGTALPATGDRQQAAQSALVVERSARILVIALSIGAAAIHVAAAPVHIAELGPLGLGFPIAAILQAGVAAAWWFRPSKNVAWAAIAVNLAIAIGWVASRVIGLPAGDEPWRPEAAGVPDVSSTLFELLVVAIVAARLTGRDVALARRLRDATAVATVAVVPLIGVVFLATLLSVSVAAGGEHHAADHDHDNANAAETSHDGP
jgi:hypothetical protein